MKILVTGSSGFIGARLVSQALADGHEVLGIDRNSPLNAEHEPFFQKVDIMDGENLLRSLTSFAPQAVIHLAARIDLYEEKDLNGYAANFLGTENLLNAVGAAPSVVRGIYASTQLVCRLGGAPQSETDYTPDSLYGRSKVLMEQLVRSKDGAGKEWCLVRPTGVWGPGMSWHYCKFLRLIQQGHYFHVGKRPIYRSLSYVGNLVHQCLQLVKSPAPNVHRRVFYLADYEPVSLRAWANAFQIELGAKPIPTAPEWLARTLAKAGDFALACGWRRFPFHSVRLRHILTESCHDLKPTQGVCGPLPYSMENGVRQTVSWFKRIGETR